MTAARWDADSQRVVAVGASAGGLDALEQLVSGLPLDSGLAFVIVARLPGKQIAKLPALLARSSTLPVSHAAAGHRLEPNTAVVVAPNTVVKRYRGRLALREVEGARRTRPIDTLFASLAAALGDRATGVLLSGTGDDGAEGLRQILAARGTAIVQGPAMPPHRIGRELRGISNVGAADDLVALLTNVDLALVIVDTERRVRRFTPRAREVIQLIPSDVGRPIADLHVIIPDLDRRIDDVLTSAIVHESTIERHDGTTYRMQIRPCRSGDAGISGAVITFFDITELHHTVRAAQAARDQAAAIVEAVPTPLAVVDNQLRLISFNRAFAELFGGRTGDLLAIGQWRSPGVRDRLVETLGSGDGFDDLETEHTEGSRTRTFRLAARRLPGDHHLLIGIADITPLRDAEAAREATRRERDAFLGAVSHELRTPLSTILLWAEALRGFSAEDPRRLDAIAAIIEAASGETQLVEDLLDLALSRTAGLTVVPEPVDATAVVRDVLTRLAPTAEEKQLVLTTSLAPSTHLVADPRRLRQIVANLVGNAIKFTPNGGTIGVTLERREQQVVLRVQDTGAGLPPEVVSHAFEPFWQADGSTTRPHGGLGIGLSLVRNLVDRHGGTIAVASPGDGQGSTFTVRFPTTAPKPSRSRQ